jgi:hypothetical protein
LLKSIWQTESLTFCYVIFPHGSQEVWKIFEVNNTYILTNFGEKTTRLLRIIPHRKLKYSFTCLTHGTFNDLNNCYMCPLYWYPKTEISQFLKITCHNLTNFKFCVLIIFQWISCWVKKFHINCLYGTPYIVWNT